MELPSDQTSALEKYCTRLWDWNERLNLTRHTTYEKFVSRDVVDSLQLANLLAPKKRVLDVGTGGGVPGAVIAIFVPTCTSLCESVAKKAKAIEAIVREAELPTLVCIMPALKIAAGKTEIRFARDSGRCSAGETSHLVQTALVAHRPAAGDQRTSLGRRARRGSAPRLVQRASIAQGRGVSVGWHPLGKCDPRNPAERRKSRVTVVCGTQRNGPRSAL